MKEVMIFWLAKPVMELVIGLCIVALILFMLFLFHLPGIIRRALCRHDGTISETMACDAICRKCGKNLGFIGTWRAKQAAKKNGGAQ